MESSSIQYLNMMRPTWAPPSWIFGPVWTVLYLLIALSFGTVFVMFYKKEIPFKVVLPFILNLVFNFSFTYFQFGIENNILASIDILLVLGTIVWLMFAICPYKKWIMYIQIPYLLWVSFATVLQLTITFMNL